MSLRFFVVLPSCMLSILQNTRGWMILITFHVTEAIDLAVKNARQRGIKPQVSTNSSYIFSHHTKHSLFISIGMW